MLDPHPHPIPPKENQRRLARVTKIARGFGFIGEVEYRHDFSKTGGAQYVIGATPDKDRLVVFVEAFEKDADPEDYSLEAIIAHERGHQILKRDQNLQRYLVLSISGRTEEILASLIGSLIVGKKEDSDDLYFKALGDAIIGGLDSAKAVRLVQELQGFLEEIL